MMGILVPETCWGNKTAYFVASSWVFTFTTDWILEEWGSFPARVRDSYPLRNIQAGTVADSVSYAVRINGYSARFKLPSYTHRAEGEKNWGRSSTSSYTFMVWYDVRGSFILPYLLFSFVEVKTAFSLELFRLACQTVRCFNPVTVVWPRTVRSALCLPSAWVRVCNSVADCNTHFLYYVWNLDCDADSCCSFAVAVVQSLYRELLLTCWNCINRINWTLLTKLKCKERRADSSSWQQRLLNCWEIVS
jgi:hypothetical protein